MPTPEQLLGEVKSHETFIAFVEALAQERAVAEAIERRSPDKYCLDGALNWKNGDICSFLHAALQYFNAGALREPNLEASWKVFAEILWCGKIIE